MRVKIIRAKISISLGALTLNMMLKKLLDINRSCFSAGYIEKDNKRRGLSRPSSVMRK